MSIQPDAVKAEAARLGFLACGVTHPGPIPHARELDDWLARGHAGTMRYLHRQAAKRKEPQRIVPEARAVVVVLDNYGNQDQPAPGGVRIARYARGRDYHEHLGGRLRALADWLLARGAGVARPYVDAGPVPERELAQRAGLGWIGKNTMLIRPGTGSFFFIGSIFTDLPLTPDPAFTTDHCGTCTRCLEACPTDALVAPHQLDATRCISYLTIEYRGEFTPEQEASLRGWGFGCDICNEVCPWNLRFAEPSHNPAYRPLPDWEGLGPEPWERMTEEEFQRRFGHSPLERAGLKGMRRNWRAAKRERKA